MAKAREIGWNVAPALLIVLALLASYSNAWDTAFLFDDYASIVENPLVLNDAPLRALIEPNAGIPQGATLASRPVAASSFALNHWISGMSPAGFRAGNLLIHCVSAWLMFSILLETFRRSGTEAQKRDAYTLAAGISLFWAVHPLHTAVVTYTVQRAESLAGLFYLATWSCFIQAVLARERAKDGGRAWAAASVVCCFAGMASKEVMVSAPLTVLLYDRVFFAGSFRTAWRRHGRWHLGLFASWALLATTLSQFSLRNPTIGDYVGVSWIDYFLSQGYFISRYVFLVFWPGPLVFDYGFTPIHNLTLLVGGVALVASWGALTLWAWPRHPKFAFAGYLFFAALAPSSSVIPVGTEIAAEHRMYLPSIVPIALAVLGLHHWLVRRSAFELRRRTLPLLLAALVAATLCLRTYERNRMYADPRAIWEDTVAKAPNNVRAWSEAARLMGNDARRERDPAVRRELLRRALEMADRAVEVNPGYGRAFNERGSLRLANGDPRGALEDFTKAIEVFPNDPAGYLSRGQLLHERNPGAAYADYSAALDIMPSMVVAALNRAALRLSRGETEGALADYDHVLRYRPNNAMAWSNRGVVLERLGRYREALASHAKSLFYYEQMEYQPGVDRERAEIDRLTRIAAQDPETR
jgi:tetratricopeptide (TPR) repeat protein